LRTLHFVGIGGIGMSAIARILLERGERITGSDAIDSPLLNELRAAGATISVGHDPANVNGATTVVVSAAIDPENPEYRSALERGIPVLRRGEMLARIMKGRRGIAICGTHGKTTTTAMAAAVLRGAKIDASLVLGGIDSVLGTNAYDGTAPWFLTEADESDGSFALLDPEIAVVTNIENDHLSSDAELPKLTAAFEEFLARVPAGGCVIVGVDNPLSRSLAHAVRRAASLTFGIAADAEVHASNIRFGELRSTFELFISGERLGSVELQVPGAMNVENALGAAAVGRALDIPFASIAESLHGFRGVRRRFDVLAKNERMVVVDDYAHHPTAVRETIAAARRYHRGPIVAVFQPHRYSRTAHLAPGFAEALADADRVYLTPIYGAGEAPIDGVSEKSIGDRLEAAGVQVSYVKYAHDLRAVLLREAPQNSLVLMLGAGNITKVAADLARDVSA
jgi:UDP-N-acetylmuramate--alanine ligase